MTLTRERILVRYGIAALFVGAIAAIRLGITTVIGHEPAFLLFLAAVMGAAWIGGAGPGLFATVLSLLVADFFFRPPYWQFKLFSSAPELTTVLFAIEASVIAVLAGMLHRARDAALAGQAEARALQAELLRVSDDERRRIGHDLHDGLGQQLTGVALLSKVLGQRLADRGMPESAQAQQIATLANEMIGQAKHLARGLDPVPIRPNGLAEALFELCESSQRVFGVVCTLETDGESLTTERGVDMHLFRIAQEAVSNAVKHGAATHITVALRGDSRAVTLSVANDGKPFRLPGNIPAESGRTGMGLRIMKHRARLIGATLDIDTTADGRTVLTCRLPIAPGDPHVADDRRSAT